MVIEMKLEQLLFVLQSELVAFDDHSLYSLYTAHSPFVVVVASHLDSALVVHFQVIVPR